MRKIIVALLLILDSAFLFGQNPLVKQWDHRFGGIAEDGITCMQQTADGGFILAGSSHSGIGGDKTQSMNGVYDYWIVKTDSLGNKEWDKDFGGSNSDYLTSLHQTSDGGYILGGASTSGNNGDKSQPNHDITEATNDYWIIKIDALGNKQWDKTFGGVDDDELTTVLQTTDGGYVISGHSLSGVGGDKTQPNQGGNDYWIIKTDSLGTKLWDKNFGGAAYDYLNTIQQTTDGGYILGGYSNSGISGDKTFPNWDLTGNTSDYWIVKINATGNFQWDKVIGGTNGDALISLKQTNDGGYILAGNSVSGIGGNKSQSVWGGWDFWIVKTDNLGIVQWNKDYGGTLGEELFNISQTNDGGYLISGDSYSPIGGNKTENNLGIEQIWTIKTDPSGNKEWDKTVFTNGHDETGLAIQTTDGCYAMATLTAGGIAGHKTQPAWSNSYDYWLVKFCDSTLTTSINQIETNQYPFTVYPNPVTTALNVRVNNNQHIVITNLLGEVMMQKNVEPINGNLVLDVSTLTTGIYFIKAGNAVQKFIKE